MSILYFKSLLSICMIILSIIAMFTMLEIIGKGERKYNIEKLKKIHKANGALYFIIFLFITYFCLSFIINSKSELSARSTFHSIFALTIIVLMALKVSFIRIYRQFYGKVQTLGILIALITFGLMGTSGGYYLLVTEFGIDKTFDKMMEYKTGNPVKTADRKEGARIVVRTDPESILKGKGLYESKCFRCHKATSTEWHVGPGHKGIMKNQFLPVSKKPATPENIANQLRNPLKDMPSYAHLPDEDILNIIAYLNTL
ncbi:MAG: cytochrome c [Nitrospirae bacterium]|nr:cytochrome c [Nitrospirota bacterium]